MTEVLEKAAPDSYRTSHASPGHGAYYSKTYEHGYYAHQWQLIERPLLRSVFAKIKNREKVRYLDFACGTGRILGVGEEFFDDTTGIDISDEMLYVAGLNCTKSKLIRQDITRAPLRGTYDVITAFRFFLNAEPLLADEVLGALYDLLPETGGTMFINIHVNRNSPLGLIYELRNLLVGRNLANTKSYGVFRGTLEQNGFAVEKVHWYSFLPRLGWRFERASQHMMIPTERVFGSLRFCDGLAQSFLIHCRKV